MNKKICYICGTRFSIGRGMGRKSRPRRNSKSDTCSSKCSKIWNYRRNLNNTLMRRLKLKKLKGGAKNGYKRMDAKKNREECRNK